MDKNREAWLTELAEMLRPTFKGFSLGKLRITCGWPSRNATGARSRTVGQCFAPECSRDGTTELFISPLLDDPLEVAGTTAHELAHAAAGVKAAHGKRYVTVCRHVGLTAGPPRQVMPGPHLNDHLRGLIAGLGVYPHKALSPTATTRPKAPGSVGLVCPAEGCGCKVQISKKLLDKCGPPTCGCGAEFMEKGEDTGEDD